MTEWRYDDFAGCISWLQFDDDILTHAVEVWLPAFHHRGLWRMIGTDAQLNSGPRNWEWAW